jgi:hypothetical protein
MAEMIKEQIGIIGGFIVVGIFAFPIFFGRWCPPVVRARGKFAELIWSTKNGLILGVVLAVAYIVLILTGTIKKNF